MVHVPTVAPLYAMLYLQLNSFCITIALAAIDRIWNVKPSLDNPGTRVLEMLEMLEMLE